MKSDTSKTYKPDLNLFENDTVTISNIEELALLSIPSKVRRFRFWVWHGWLSNPTVYFLELTNDNANYNTSLMAFIKGATLTFVYKGWVII